MDVIHGLWQESMEINFWKSVIKKIDSHLSVVAGYSAAWMSHLDGGRSFVSWPQLVLVVEAEWPTSWFELDMINNAKDNLERVTLEAFYAALSFFFFSGFDALNA